MDNLTHSLIGLAAAKAGLEKLSPGATTLCVLAANSPDGDIVTLLFGRWVYLQQHRGVSHSIIGVVLLGLALPLVFYLGDALLASASKGARRVKPVGLVIASVVATATHPLMDWTNNYGVRPLLPWNPRWFYGDFVFIIDPFIWLVLGGAGFLLTAKTKKQRITWVIIGLATTFLVMVGPRFQARELSFRLFWLVAVVILVILYQRNLGKRAGAKVAIAALAVLTIYCAGLAGAHLFALRQAHFQATTVANGNGETVNRVAAMPTLANPSEWVCVLETDQASYRFNLSLFSGQTEPANLVRYEKLVGLEAEALAQAARDSRSQVFLDFARFPVVGVVGEDCASQTLVQFADLRYTEPGRGRGTFSLDLPVDCPDLEKRGR